MSRINMEKTKPEKRVEVLQVSVLKSANKSVMEIEFQ